MTRWSKPPKGVIVKQVTHSAKMWSRIWDEDNDESEVAIALLLNNSTFSKRFSPEIEMNSSPSIDVIVMLSLTFSVSSPRILQLNFFIWHGSNWKHLGWGSASRGWITWLLGLGVFWFCSERDFVCLHGIFYGLFVKDVGRYGLWWFLCILCPHELLGWGGT